MGVEGSAWQVATEEKIKQTNQTKEEKNLKKQNKNKNPVAFGNKWSNGRESTMLTGKTFARVQHGFGGMQNKTKMRHGMWDDRNGGMQYFTGKGFVQFDRRDAG